MIMKFPRPDGVSLTGGLICLGYEDNDERDLAFDWLEAFGNGDVRGVNQLAALIDALDNLLSDDLDRAEESMGREIKMHEMPLAWRRAHAVLRMIRESEGENAEE